MALSAMGPEIDQLFWWGSAFGAGNGAWREHGCDKVDRHQHVDEPQMANFGAVVNGDFRDVEQGGLKSDRSLRVVIECVDCAPDHEGNQYSGEALPEEFTLIFDGKKEESGNHDEQRHADAQEQVCPSHGPGPRRVQYGSVW